jgi:hypothetical protein
MKKILIENLKVCVVFQKNHNIRKLTPKVPYVRTRMEHILQHAGLCSLSGYQVARWYARPENHNFLHAYVRPQYAVPDV